MSQVKNGNTVKVHLTGRLENGEVFRGLSENSNFFSNRGMRKKLPQVYG
ncbi:MAG: FKBP-type peptidyl-prolyl cis-trans isomerase [Thermodesulfobacteriota bacterium]|nr:FKBP-type peptidyl-prolyl cis-trans isomerase [Thermodesulfobacteriota bacterium]